MEKEKISKKEARQFFVEKFKSRKGTINLTNEDILDIYLTRSFGYPVDSYSEETLEEISSKLKDVLKSYPKYNEASAKNVEKIKLSFTKAVDEELLELINYDNCNISLKSLIELLPYETLANALDDMNNEFKPTLTKIYVVVDRICKNKNGKKYSIYEINRCIMTCYKDALEVAEYNQNKYGIEFEVEQEKTIKKEKKAKNSNYEPYYNNNEIDDYGDNTEYPTNIINSRTILK